MSDRKLAELKQLRAKLEATQKALAQLRAQQRAQRPPSEVYLSIAEVRVRYGGVSAMWIERRLTDPESGFPKPYYFGSGRRRRHWAESELDEWDRACARRFSGTSARARHPEATPQASG
jgi:predicted DNA-binding transcriptional regulator AlpA